jgi:hypothetical protein
LGHRFESYFIAQLVEQKHQTLVIIFIYITQHEAMDTFVSDQPAAGLQNAADTAQRVLEENGITPDRNLRLSVVTTFNGQFSPQGEPLFNVTTYLGGSAAEISQDIINNPQTVEA